MDDPIKIPTIDEDSHHAPPWKVDAPFPDRELGVWGVTTDRGDPRDEYDVFEDPPEWAVRLAALAPSLHAENVALRAEIDRLKQLLETTP